MSKRITIGIDLDDVIWDLLGCWLKRYNEIADDNVMPEDIESWDIAQYINKGTREMLFYVFEYPDFWDKVEPMPHSQTYLQRLIEDGYDVVVVTASSHKTLKPKLNHFYDLFPFISKQQVIIAERKQLINLDLLVDDNPANLCNGSYKKVLFNAPHNQWCYEENIGAKRLSTWTELYEYIKKEFPIERSHIEG